MSQILYLTILTTIIATVTSNNNQINGRIESCPSCSLNRLPEVKSFIYEDVQKYDNIYWKKIHGAIPELIMLDAQDNEIERLQLSKLTRKECNELLLKKGFKLKPEFAKEEF